MSARFSMDKDCLKQHCPVCFFIVFQHITHLPISQTVLPAATVKGSKSYISDHGKNPENFLSTLFTRTLAYGPIGLKASWHIAVFLSAGAYPETKAKRAHHS